MFDLIRDVRHAARRLLRTPAFTLATLVTLALGIGANTAIFSVVDSVLLKPLPFPEPDRLVGLWQTAPGVDIKDLNASIADYVTYREESRTLADVAIWNGTALNVTGVAEPERVDGLNATFRLLPMLGVKPIFGRSFVEADNDRGSPEVVMLGYGYWQRRFGGNPAAVGRRIMVDGTAREIIGVLPQGFWFMDMTHDLVVPLRFERAKVRLAGYNFQAIGRLRPGVTLAQVDADVARMIGVALAKFPPPEGMSIKMMEDARLGPNVRPLLDDLVGDIGKSLWVVMATIGMVLLIACANVANLLLVRTEGRAQELAVRAAIGAGRGRLAREMLVESLLLGLLGGAAGIAFAIAALKLVLTMNPAKLPRLELIAVDATSLVFTLVVSVAAGLAFGAIPVLKHARVRLAEALRGGGRNASASRDRNITRNTLTIVQVALALVLLIGSGLMIRTFQSMRRVQPGFTEPATLQTLRIAIPGDVAKDDARVLLTQQSLVDALAALPGVTSVSVISALPMTGMSSQDPVAASDHTYRENQIPPLRRFIRTVPKTFQVLGTPLTAGRDYDWTDIHQRRDVVLISDNFAREYWGSAAGRDRQAHPLESERPVERGHRRGGRHASRRRRPAGAFDRVLAAAGQQIGGLHPPRSASWHRELRDRNPPRGVHGEREPAGHAGADDAAGLRQVDGADRLHVDAAGDQRRDGPAPRRHRHLRRDLLYRVAADARDRDPHGARRAAGSPEDDVRPQRAAVGRHRRRGRPRRRRDALAADVGAALRDQPDRSADLRRRRRGLARRRRRGQLCAGPPRHPHQSSRGAPRRVDRPARMCAY